MKKTRCFFSAVFLVFTTLLCAQQTLNVALNGNGYVTAERDGARITKNGLREWTDPQSVISVFFYLHQPQEVELSLLASGQSEIAVTCANQQFIVQLTEKNDVVTVPVGKVNIPSAGYVRVDLQGTSLKNSSTFGDVDAILVGNVVGEANYVTDFSEYWGRRGPSVHLNYPVADDMEVEWFYNEVTVPAQGEVMQSYYMAAGFGEGYFGMQYNSARERRVLFSVWSPYDTQNPKNIPEEYRIKMLRRGKDVHIGEFGNEGSGGQSYLRYPWKAGQTYKFLMRVCPDGQGNTVYTAYFYATDEAQWRLIASFMRPHTDTWYKRPHSFLENFSPEQGYLTRSVYFDNQWVRTTSGQWVELTESVFTNDATARANVRLDYQGGVDDNRFYLKMGGFFDEHTTYRTAFSRPAKGIQPDVDVESLPQE